MYGQTLSPSVASIYLGPMHIDDCYAIKFSSEDSSSPLYQYDQATYSGVATGKTLVSGSIAIVSRYAGYLRSALMQADRLKTPPHQLENLSKKIVSENKELDEWVQKMKSANSVEKFNLLADAARKGPDFLRQASNISWFANGVSKPSSNSQTEFDYPHEYQRSGNNQQITPATIWIYYDDLDGIMIADKLEGVVFLGVAKSLSAAASPAGDVSASGVPIIEIYPFFAKRAIQLLLNNDGWTSR